jgi:hypothetical protein
MWDFIKYCLWCLGILISGSQGNNPEGMSLKTGFIGVLTAAVLLALLFLILYLIGIILNKYRRYKNLRKTKINNQHIK